MNNFNHIIILFLFFGLISCKNQRYTNTVKDKTEKNTKADIEIDHLNIWVTNPKKAKEKLVDIGFTSVPDSLSEIHHGQGTAGRYFYFLNGYLELIFVYDYAEFGKNNEINKNLDFPERAKFNQNGAAPFSIALKLNDYSVEKIPFKTVKYHQNWMESNANIYAAKNSKKNINEPSIFVIYPEIKSGTFESLSELENFPTDNDYWKAFFKHPNGAKKITNIIITSTDLDLKTETIEAVNNIENIEIKNGSKHSMELYFDNNIQKKSFDLRPELPLIIYL